MIIELNDKSINLIELIIALFAVLIAFITFYYQRKTQRDSLLNNISLVRLDIWNRKQDESDSFYLERVINFYEYVSFLILDKRIDEEPSKTLFKDDIDIIFKKWGKKVKSNKCWVDIVELNKKWK